ncbi:MAG: hypothetical protein ACI4WG_01375, partial [Erysipelotrichaceae bacterium]
FSYHAFLSAYILSFYMQKINSMGGAFLHIVITDYMQKIERICMWYLFHKKEHAASKPLKLFRKTKRHGIFRVVHIRLL